MEHDKHTIPTGTGCDKSDELITAEVAEFSAAYDWFLRAIVLAATSRGLQTIADVDRLRKQVRSLGHEQTLCALTELIRDDKIMLETDGVIVMFRAAND